MHIGVAFIGVINRSVDSFENFIIENRQQETQSIVTSLEQDMNALMTLLYRVMSDSTLSRLYLYLDSGIKVQHYIEENSSYELQIEDIALFAHTSVSFLYKVFKEYSNFTPMAYLSYVRISKAAEMLKTTDKKIKEIALECGFVSIQTFNRQFGQQMNCSPREYRLLFADKNAENS